MYCTIRTLVGQAICLFLVLHPDNPTAFCGFYVTKADTKLYNRASKVVLVRDGDRTVITMANDFQGDPKEFAMVIPVPVFIERKQIHITKNSIIDHLDAYTAPRLAEYFDENPCRRYRLFDAKAETRQTGNVPVVENIENARDLGVTIEAEYSLEEYDILILSAEQSGGLETWLTRNGYCIPEGAGEILASYIRQNMHFFVAKLDLGVHADRGFKYLRPLSVAYESPKFMLPIRLGTVNADGPQELFIFAMTRRGRVETTNYRTVKIPSNLNVPLYVKDEFDDFYRSMFDTAVRKDRMKTVFLEYAWDMNWCDPCATAPLSDDELKELGVFWLGRETGQNNQKLIRRQPRPKDVFVTRLHVRYDADHFPDDLRFQETGDSSNFQGRYMMSHPWKGDPEACDQVRSYFKSLPKRFENEAQTLAKLTGWDIIDIRRKMEKSGQSTSFSGANPDENWVDRLWR